jgi:hypothetical protein
MSQESNRVHLDLRESEGTIVKVVEHKSGLLSAIASLHCCSKSHWQPVDSSQEGPAPVARFSRSRSRSPRGVCGDAESEDSDVGHDRFDFNPKLNAPMIPPPPAIPGCEWWRAFLIQAFQSERERLPRSPARSFRLEELCQGLGTASYALKALLIMCNRMQHRCRRC